MMSKEDQKRMDENFAFIEHVLERDLGINLHPEMPVYESNETKEELEAWIEEQVYGPEEEKWNDVVVDESVKLIPVESVRSMIESGEMEWEEDGDGFEDEIANRIQDELFDYLDDCGYFIANKGGNETDITRYTLNGWYSLRPDEFKYYRGGMEWDYVAYAYWYLMRNYERIKKHAFLILHIDENGPVSYPFMIYQVGKKWYHHESAFKDNIIHEEFDSPAEAVEAIMNRWKDKAQYTDGITKIAEYTPWDHYEQKFDEFYVSIFEDYRNWLKKYAPLIFVERGGWLPPEGGYSWFYGGRRNHRSKGSKEDRIEEFSESRERHREYLNRRKLDRQQRRYAKKPLKHAIRMGWDYNTGHQVHIIFDFKDSGEIIDVGTSHYAKNHPDNRGLPSLRHSRARHDKYLDYVKKNARTQGNGDFESKGHMVKAVVDMVTKETIKRPVIVMSPFMIDHYGYTHMIDLSKDSLVLKKCKDVADQMPDMVRRVQAGKIDNEPSFKSTVWPSIRKKDKDKDKVDRFSRIINAQREKGARGKAAQDISRIGIRVVKDYNKMSVPDILGMNFKLVSVSSIEKLQ